MTSEKAKVGNFTDPEYTVVDESTEGYDQSKLDTAKTEISDDTDRTSGKSRGLYEEQLATPKSKLDQNADKNIAAGQSQYGMYNRRNYATTLRLAREADRYNNKPIDHMFSVGTNRTGGIKDLGTGYDRPKIQTMETRAMDQALQLDTNQKELAQALQAAVNAKDLDAFRQVYAQLYGIQLTEMQARQAMTQYLRQNEINQRMFKDRAVFENEFPLKLKGRGLAVLYDLAKGGNNVWATFAAAVLYGEVPPQLSSINEQEWVKSYLVSKLGPNYKNTASAYDIESTRREAQTNFAAMSQYHDQVDLYQTSSQDAFWSRRSQKKQGKAAAARTRTSLGGK